MLKDLDFNKIDLDELMALNMPEDIQDPTLVDETLINKDDPILKMESIQLKQKPVLDNIQMADYLAKAEHNGFKAKDAKHISYKEIGHEPFISH